MTRAWIALLVAAAAGCSGPDPVCVSQCETENDACMLSAPTAEALQRCDEGLNRCLAYCR